MSEILRKPLRVIRHNTYRCIDLFLPAVTHRKYMGISLYYSKGTGLVDRLRFLSPHKVYEDHICAKITSFLEKTPHKTFFDVGANIGLISAYIHKYSPDTHVYCFEPGIHQRALLELTVFHNSLESSMQIFPYALSNENGTATFATNTESYAVGGDGFVDTVRSPHETKSLSVETLKLDTFCERHNVIPDVIKIDIEGAELWALEGMEETLKAHEPVVFFEMHPANIAVYPYSVADIFMFFSELGYIITTSDEQHCTAASVAAGQHDDDMYIATKK